MLYRSLWACCFDIPLHGTPSPPKFTQEKTLVTIDALCPYKERLYLVTDVSDIKRVACLPSLTHGVIIPAHLPRYQS